MRNGQIPIQQQQRQSQQQLNESIEYVRGLMQQVKNAQNPQAQLAQILQNNPSTAAIANMVNNGGNLEQMARQMAAAQGINIDQLIKQLGA